MPLTVELMRVSNSLSIFLKDTANHYRSLG